MSVPVPLEELAAALAHRSNAAYLITVGDDGTAHCVASTLEWAGDELVAAAGATSLRYAASRGSVVLLAPPPDGLVATAGDLPGEPGGALDAYSLIVDAGVTGTTSNGVRLRPEHAVFHRPAVVADRHGHGDGCVHDCVHVYDQERPAG